MDNGFPTVVSGLIKRPPSEYIADMQPSITLGDAAAVHTIDRDVSEKYILVCGSGDLELFDTNGVKQTVSFPNGKAYLPASNMWEKLRFITVADTTFILNNEITTQSEFVMDDRVNPRTQASVFIKRAVASVVYAIYINGVLAGSFETSSNTSASTALEGTSEIASRLKTSLEGNGFTVARNGPTLTIDVNDGDTIAVDDEFGGSAMQIYTDRVQGFEDLPPTEVVDRIVQVSSDVEDGIGDSFWVQFIDGVWEECPGFEEEKRLVASTMPHILVKTGPNTFEFRENEWITSAVGDADSNPDPSFVGNSILGLFLFKGRMGLLSEENFNLSAVALFEQWQRTTTAQLLDSYPIDVASSTARLA